MRPRNNNVSSEMNFTPITLTQRLILHLHSQCFTDYTKLRFIFFYIIFLKCYSTALHMLAITFNDVEVHLNRLLFQLILHEHDKCLRVKRAPGLSWRKRENRAACAGTIRQRNTLHNCLILCMHICRPNGDYSIT